MPKHYCVTGGTGFIASYIVKALLQRGHCVRATVRDPTDDQKVAFLRELPGAKDRLELFKADLTEEGSFDDAVEGVDGVFHAASPVMIAYDDNVEKSLIEPALKGIENVLTACARSSSVKRVVLTSSCSAVRYRDDAKAASPLGEHVWSDVDYCKRNKLWYAYSKTMGERAAWQMAAEKGVELVAVLPSLVVGPLLGPRPTSTLQIWLSIVKGESATYPNMKIGFVHIDDVVEAHIAAMENREVSGRLICSGPVAHFSEVIEMLKKKYPAYPYPATCDDRPGDNIDHCMDTTKHEQLGLPSFRSIEQMFDDFIKSFQDKGFL